MKKLIVIVALVFFATTALAENFIAVKGGYVKYNKEADSIYEGSHIYYPATGYGIILGNEKDDWITRLDISRERTGVEFSNAFPIAYDGFRLNSFPITLQFGKKFNNFYALLGGGIMFNDADIWEYAPSPFNAKMNNSICGVATIGYKTSGKVFGFIEGRYLYAKSKVNIAGYDSFTEDLSNLSAWAGIGVKF